MTPTDDPPFTSIAVVGFGLIGGSIALSVRERWPSTRIIAHDRTAVLAHALGSGAVDRAADRLVDIGTVDLVVLAAPVRKNIELLSALARELPAIPLVTDVGGTKREIVQAARALPASITFVGGHPLGGGEHGGFGFARPDLFKGKPWIFSPAEGGEGARDGAALERLFLFARSLGARPSTLSPPQHDRLMAFLSHLPQLTASALMDTVGRGAGDLLPLAGRGLVDTTRLASSPANVWRDICATNSDAIGDALDALIERLQELRADVSRGDALERIFADAARWRGDLMKGRDQ